MTTISIEKNIPQTKIQGGAHRKYPFSEMVKGDSFDFGEYDRIKMQSMYGCVYYFLSKKENAKKKFVCRKTEDGRMRVWRTK